MDLNLLPVLRELLRTHNVTRAAANLNMAQSAASEALRRLRQQFKDEILVRVGRDMVLTQFAKELAERVELAMAGVERLLSVEQCFDPSSLRRQFVIATADCVTLALGSGLVTRFAASAPAASVQFVDLQHVPIRDLERGSIDLIIRPLLADEPHRPDRSVALYQEEWVYIARRGHPVITRDLTPSCLEHYASIAYRPEPESLLRTAPHASLVDQMHVPQFNVIPFIVESTDAVAMIQRDIAERMAGMLDIEILAIPSTMTTSPVVARWADIHENDPAHRWFRGVVAAAGEGYRLTAQRKRDAHQASEKVTSAVGSGGRSPAFRKKRVVDVTSVRRRNVHAAAMRDM